VSMLQRLEKLFAGACVAVIGVTTATLAATIAVTNTADNGAGTLRRALASAANGDTINFALTTPATITLTTGQLVVSNSVTILGPGPAHLAINGNYPNTTNRVFLVSTNLVVTISSLTITNGTGFSSSTELHGAGIYNDHSTLTVSNCVLSGNFAVFSDCCEGLGGGISNDGSGGSATLIVVDSTFSYNIAIRGGGIYNVGLAPIDGGTGTVTVVNSTFSGNLAGAWGGGIRNDGVMTVVNSTFSDNYFAIAGGAIHNDGPLTVVSSTFSGNSAEFDGGIRNFGDGILTIANSTFSGNSNTTSGAGAIGNFGTMEIGNTIFNAGASGANITNDTGTVTSLGFNLSSDGGGGVLTNATDQINTDPLLGPLQNNGGLTFTHALMAGSPAIDKGKRDAVPALAADTDQRGAPRPFDDPNITNAIGGDGSDIGAYEASELRITAVEKFGNDLRLSFTSVLGTNYVVQSRSDLDTGDWAVLPGLIPGYGGISQTTQTNALSQPKQFFRIQLQP
jgi:hypothetical protein